MPTPQYHPTGDSGVHRLHYSWTGWPSGKRFSSAPLELINETSALWRKDGLEVIESSWSPEQVRIFFAASPQVSPVLVASRAKGRLDHALRTAGLSIPLSRKVSVRALGENTRRDVEAYIERQVEREQFADPRFEQALQDLLFVDEKLDLSQPAASSHGRYWYNLHLVLVTEGRSRIHDVKRLRDVRDATLRIAAKKEHAISRLSVMPDHLHAALRPQITDSPLEVAHAYLNNLAYMLDSGRIWQDGYYLGTFGEYTTYVIVERPE
jgi:REP element-mobilizing transposase RayT